MGSSIQPIVRRTRRFFRVRGWVGAVGLGAAAVAGGCGSESAVTTDPTPVKCQVALGTPSSSIGSEGGAGTLSVTTTPECPWDVHTAANWLSGLSPASGQGTSTVAFRVEPNPLPSIREGEIVVNDSRLRVSQQAALCRFELRPDRFTADAKGETREVAVSTLSGCSWTIATDANWVSLATRTGSGAGTVRVSMAPNPGDEQRIGAIILADQRSIVTQGGSAGTSGPPLATGPCTFQVGPSNAAIGAAGGSGTVSVVAGTGCTWTASRSAAWVTVTSGASGSGNGSVGFSVAANTGGARSSTLTIAGQTVTVTQAGAAASCTYSISPTSTSMAAAGGTGTVTVSSSSGCAWSTSSGAGWVTVTSGGSGNGSVTFNVAANTGGARSGNLTIAGQTFTVTQGAAAASCSYSISPTSASISGAKTGTVAVSTTSGCVWTASSNADWITVTSGASGTGSGTVTYSAAAPRGKDDKTGTVTIAGHTFTVKQKK
jgi:hypothetical protein